MSRFGLAIVIGLSLVYSVLAVEPPPHGGQRLNCGEHRCEVVWEPTSVKVHILGDGAKSPTVERMRGLLLLTPGGQGTATRLNLLPCGPGCLRAEVDLSRFDSDTMKVQLYLTGQGTRVSRTTAELKFRLDPDAVAIAQQVICPVTGEPLGAMGKPAKGVVEGRTVYVCCEPCLDFIREEPARYLAKVGLKPAQNLGKSTLVVSTDADTGAIARQGVCPVMGAKLGAMGAPWKMTLAGREVFICCKGCAPKLEREPEKYIAKMKD